MPSQGFNFLYKDRNSLVRNKTPFIKYGCMLIPLLKQWNEQQSEAIGVLIISDLTDNLGSRKDASKNDNFIGASVSALMNELFRRTTPFIDLLLTDVAMAKTHQIYRCISEISRHHFISQNVQVFQ